MQDGERGVTVGALVAQLAGLHPQRRILFDTEAARFAVHCVTINFVDTNPYGFEQGGDVEENPVILHTNEPREH